MENTTMTLKQKIDEACREVGLSRTKLAKILGMSQVGFNKSVNIGKFTQARLTEIGNALGVSYYARFEFGEDVTVSVDGKASLLEPVGVICAHSGISLSDLAVKLGFETKEKFASKLEKGKFTQEELCAVAESAGCHYECGFNIRDDSAQIANDNYKTAVENEPKEVLTEAEIERKEEARLRKNARQREYARRTRYEVNIKSRKKNTRRVLLELNLNTDGDVLKQLDEVGNKQGYIKSLIREDISKKSLNVLDNHMEM